MTSIWTELRGRRVRQDRRAQLAFQVSLGCKVDKALKVRWEHRVPTETSVPPVSLVRTARLDLRV